MLFQTVAVLCFLTTAIGSPIGGRIVNGTDAQEGEFPYIISLRVADRHSCGGSIVNERYVLTAAHCAGYNVSYYSIQYGVTTITPGTSAPNVIKVSKIHVHKDYVVGNGYINDIAVLELEEAIPFGQNVQPVRLPRAFNPTPENAGAVLAGWGFPYTGGSLMTNLQKVDILVYSDADCERIHQNTGPTSRKYHVCAGVPEGGKGQCSGDSGSPLMVNGVQIGVVSWSVKPCTIRGYPGVFAKVANYMPWIRAKAVLQ